MKAVVPFILMLNGLNSQIPLNHSDLLESLDQKLSSISIFFDILSIVIPNRERASNITSELNSLVDRNRDLILHNKKIIYSEDGAADFIKLAKKYVRKPVEEYDVTTQDGYILKLYHIPGNIKKTVLFCHGNLVSADNYLIRGNISLIYMLAEQNMDVWAMNYRGNKDSRRHVSLNPDSHAFWQYSLHEIGVYDYPTIIDFILRKTGQRQLSIAGHSEGATGFFILTTERPEYNKKIKVFVGLAPITYLSNSGRTISALMRLSQTVNFLLRLLKIEEFMGYYSFAKRVVDIICSHGLLGYNVCLEILNSVSGFDPRTIEPEFMTTVLGHFPAGTSRKNMEHYTHFFRFNDFVQYNYGVGVRNIQAYGTPYPPVYDLKKVTTKIALFTSRNDGIVGVKDVERLRDNLQNVVHYQLINDRKFNHVDYIWGPNAHTVVYPFVIDILCKYM